MPGSPVGFKVPGCYKVGLGDGGYVYIDDRLMISTI